MDRGRSGSIGGVPRADVDEGIAVMRATVGITSQLGGRLTGEIETTVVRNEAHRVPPDARKRRSRCAAESVNERRHALRVSRVYVPPPARAKQTRRRQRCQRIGRRRVKQAVVLYSGDRIESGAFRVVRLGRWSCRRIHRQSWVLITLELIETG